jgi:hypothetical protein
LGYNLQMSTAAFPIEHAFDILQRPVVEAAAYAPLESEALLALLGEAANNRSSISAILAALASVRSRLIEVQSPEAARLWDDLRDASLALRGPFVEGLRPASAEQLDSSVSALRAIPAVVADEDLRRALDDSQLVLAVAGDFKRGKSTLINALLGRRVLPTRVAPATAVPCLLRSGPTTSARVFYSDGREPETVPIEDLERYACIVLPSDEEDKLAFREGVERIEIELETGLPANTMLVDLPGLNEDLDRAETAREVLRRSDAIIIVLSATQLLSENELQFIETLWSQGHRALTFAVNFVDGLEDYEVRTVRERCAAMLRPFGGVLGGNILLLSARQALRVQLAGEQAPEMSGLPTLRAHVRTQVLGQASMIWRVSRLRQVLDRLDSAEEDAGVEALRQQVEVQQAQSEYDSIAHRLQKAQRIYADGDLATAHDIAMRRKRIADYDALFDSHWAALSADLQDRFKHENLPWIWQKARGWLRDALIQAIREVHPQVMPRPEGYLRISVAPGLRIGRDALLGFYMQEAWREWRRFTGPAWQARRRELEEALAEAEREHKRLTENREASWAPLSARQAALHADIEAGTAAAAASVHRASLAATSLQAALETMARHLGS